ncbi:MAG: helix-turn-helix domain-containing protein [Psychrobium sp.]|nr:helix-turn-helix domain-containing protein [Psychrobium sp.]
MPELECKNLILLNAVKIAGSQTKLAKLIGKRQQNIWSWLYETGVTPAEFVLSIEESTGVSRQQLRPDLYPVDGIA